MHILWLIPGYMSFLVEELRDLAPMVDRVSVISQATAVEIAGVQTVTIPPTPMSIGRMARRAGSLAKGLCRLPTPIRSSERKDFLAAVRQSEFIEDFIRAEQVDVVHSHFAFPVGTAGRLGLAGRPLVLTLRGVDILVCESIGYGFRLDPYYCRTLHATLDTAAAVTVASTTSRNALIEFHGERDTFHLTPNGLDLSRFDSTCSGDSVRTSQDIEDRPMILAAGNLVAGKAFNNLIAALKIVRKIHVTAMLVVLGEGEERERLENQAKALGLEDAVRLVGKVDRDEIASYFSACDVFAQSSLTEGFGNVVLEAMAMGRPVVATQTGVVLDFLEDDRSGLSVPTGQIEPLAEAIVRFLSDRELADRCGTAGRRRVLSEDLTLKKRAERYVSLYESVSNVADRS